MNHQSNADRYPPPKPLLDVIRPNFFPGQSLSDQDLMLLMTWAEQRWRLEAACDDWGIACGLHVSINPDDDSQVLISPGYGFNAARQLVVVSDADCGCGQQPDCQCRNKKSKTFCLPEANCAGCLQEDTLVPVGPLGVKVKTSELAIFDLRLAPHDCEQEHTLGLSTNGHRNCKPSRFKASAEVTARPVVYSPPCDNPSAPEANSPATRFLARYLPDASHVPPPEKPDASFSPADIAKFRSWLEEDVRRFPEMLSLGLNLKDRLKKEITEAQLTEILGWLVFGLRRARSCKRTRSADTSIPLCRIWAKCLGAKYEILWIDESTPFRRSLDCGPRGFCVTDWIGESFKAAEHAARLAGGELAHQMWKAPESRADLMIFLKNEFSLSTTPQFELTALCVEMPSSEPNV